MVLPILPASSAPPTPPAPPSTPWLRLRGGWVEGLRGCLCLGLLHLLRLSGLDGLGDLNLLGPGLVLLMLWLGLTVLLLWPGSVPLGRIIVHRI